MEVNTLKTCTKCNTTKTVDCFYKHIKSKDGIRTYCKDCSKKYNKDNRSWLSVKEQEYWAKRPEALKAKENRHQIRKNTKNKIRRKTDQEFKKKLAFWDKQYRQKNKEKVKTYKANYRKINRSKINEYTNQRRKNDIQFKLACLLRNRVKDALKNNKRPGSAVKDVGCSLGELKSYLESKFKIGMSWENYGFTGWHVDHIIPLASFDLTNREEFLKAVHYTNLQPLWAQENFLKGSKILCQSQ